LPALSGAGCWDYELFVVSSQDGNIIPKVWFGTGMSVGTNYSSGSALTGDAANINPGTLWLRGQICSNKGSSSAQMATMFAQFHQGSGGFGTSGAMAQNASVAGLQIGISMSAVNNITVQSFRVWKTQ
jgi:hypothetical protein